MTYLVLARKWRPRSFDTLVGQDHVVRALTHALTTQRLHHAWLFTGTRGVGKTTLSRILAKSLNCHTGITPTPCGTCTACTEIDAGRFIDYIELDAASNRGVEEMTQLLEQAVYSPSSGRFKVYMIDEVHMLSGHAFNAMLKTLEEPPPHVKFILATTDPQKIPVTVLSRCLQFNLKQMTADAIIGYLEMVLQQESIAYDIPALRLLARAASGSMRDALSLTDQAIAYSGGHIDAESIQGMLGTIDQGYLTRLLQGLGAGSAHQLIQVADELAMRGLSYATALADLAVLLSRIAIEQRIPGSAPSDDPLCDDIQTLAKALHPDVVQLFYSVAVNSRQELSLAPDEYAGFVMACLRMLALIPPGSVTTAPENDVANASATPQAETVTAEAQTVSVSAPAHAQSAAPAPMPVQPSSPLPSPVQDESRPADHTSPDPVSDPDSGSAPGHNPDPDPIAETEPVRKSAAESALPDSLPVSAAPAVKADSGVVAGSEPDVMTARASDIPPWEDLPEPEDAPDYPDDDGFETVMIGEDAEALIADLAPQENKRSRAPRLERMTAESWPVLVDQLPLTGVAAELARQSEWLGVTDHLIRLRMGIATLGETSARARLRTILSEHFGVVIELDIEYAQTGDGTAYAIEQAHLERLQQQAVQSVQADPFVHALISDFGGQVVSGSIRAV